MSVPFVDLKPLENKFHEPLSQTIEDVLSRSIYIKGSYCADFEANFAEFCQSKYCVGCGNGLDALALGLLSLGIKEGDEVIVPANTFIASALAVTKCGAQVVLVDCKKDTFNIDPAKIEAAISKKTKAIMVVHLYGQPAEMSQISDIAAMHKLFIVEDCAQAHGAKFNGQTVGSFGEFGGFSFYPGKNLGALGDGGALVTNSSEVAEKAKALGNYGSDYKYHHIYQGMNSRLDELQAAVLNVKLKSLHDVNEYRKIVANNYSTHINNELIVTPKVTKGVDPVWHIYAIRTAYRDELIDYLKKRGVDYNLHYPIPIHLQPCYKNLGYKKGDFPNAERISETQLSMPMYYGISIEQQQEVIDALNSFKI